MNKEVKSASDDQITKEELAMHFYRVLRTQSGNYSESQINSNPKLRQRIIEETKNEVMNSSQGISEELFQQALNYLGSRISID